MSLLNASQQIQQNSPSSSGQTPPPSSASVPVPSHEPGRNSIQQLLNPNVESTSSAAPSNRPDFASFASSPPSAHSYQYNARPLPPPGLAQTASITTGQSTGASSPKLPADTVGPAFRAQGRPSPTGNESVEIIPGFRMTFYEADRALNIYRSLYAPYFPFVTIPVMATASDLCEKTPFLFRTIVSVAAPQGPNTQSDFREWFKRYIAEHVVVNNERRLELLQALLVHVAW